MLEIFKGDILTNTIKIIVLFLVFASIFLWFDDLASKEEKLSRTKIFTGISVLIFILSCAFLASIAENKCFTYPGIYLCNEKREKMDEIIKLTGIYSIVVGIIFSNLKKVNKGWRKAIGGAIILLIYLGYGILIFGSGCAPEQAKTEKFISGVVIEPFNGEEEFTLEVSYAVELGVDCVRFWVPWELSDPSYPLSSGRKWDQIDRVINELTEKGLCVVPLLADATTAPEVCTEQSCGRISPEDKGYYSQLCNERGCTGYAGIGKEDYIKAVKSYVDEFVERYSPFISIYNIENELNWACVHTTIAGWRTGDIWCDFEFVKEFLKEVGREIMRRDPSATVTMNFNVHDPDFVRHLSESLVYLNAAGLGAYPNYLFPVPVLADTLPFYIEIAGKTQKPVYVMETGYPSGPEERGYNEDLQSEYISGSFQSSLSSGARGYFYFKLKDSPAEFNSIKGVENFWGLIDRYGIPKPSFNEYKRLISQFQNSSCE